MLKNGDHALELRLRIDIEGLGCERCGIDVLSWSHAGHRRRFGRLRTKLTVRRSYATPRGSASDQCHQPTHSAWETFHHGSRRVYLGQSGADPYFPNPTARTFAMPGPSGSRSLRPIIAPR